MQRSIFPQRAVRRSDEPFTFSTARPRTDLDTIKVRNVDGQMLSFADYLFAAEGLLAADRPPAAGLPRINTTDRTNDQRRKLAVKPVRSPPPVPRIPQVVPQHMIGRVTPPLPVGRPAG